MIRIFVCFVGIDQRNEPRTLEKKHTLNIFWL